MKLEVLLDLISDRQLAEYVAWLDEHPDSNEEDSLDFLMNILTKRQWEDINYFLETDDFNAIPYSNWYGACIHPDGRCFEATMQDCRMLGGKFQGQGTSCGGYQRPRVMGSESVWESWQDHWMSGEANENVVNEIAEAVVKNDPAGNLVIVDNYGWYLELSNEQREDLLTKPYLHEIIYEDIERMGESWGDEDSFNAFWEPADAECYECGTKAHHTCAQCEHRWCNRHWSAPLWPYLNREEQPLCRRCAKDWIASPTHDGQTGPLGGAIFNAPEGQVFRDPSSAKDPRLKGDTPPKSVTSYLTKHPEVANLYDDDDASVMMKGVIIGCLIGAVGTIFGNLASEMIVDRWKINPDFVWDKD